MFPFKVAYKKTKRGSVIKVRDYALPEEAIAAKTEPEAAKPQVAEDKFQYPRHLKLDEIKAGIDKGLLLTGKYQASRENHLEGYVAVNINDEDVHVLIQGRECLNRAIHDDEVVVELLPESEWRSKSDMVLLPESNVESESVEDEVVSAAKKLQLIDKSIHIKPTGKIVAISKRVWRQYTGVLRRHRQTLGRSTPVSWCLFIPSDRRIPIIRIETRQYETLKDKRLVVAIDSWPRASRYPQGHYIKSLGTVGDKETENQVLLLEHDVPHHEFTDAVLNCLPSEGANWTIPQEEFQNRLDLRHINVCSVDPPGCTDIDDALHYRDIDSELCEVGVHIADVSYYVKAGTPLDQEAANRGTTVYLSDRRIDMIPELLSSNLCSLIQHQDRLAFSAIWTIQKSNAEIIDTKFTRSIINSKASLTYEKAQEMIDDKSNDGVLHKSLRGLNNLAKKLKKKRIDRGALVLARADEIRFVETESETHDRDSNLEIQHKKLVDTNSMVEEFMLLANISVANKLLSVFPEQALLRRHPKPSKVNFDDLIESAKVKGFEIRPEDGKRLSESLDKAKLPNDEFFNLMLRMIATRCMTPAAYFCSGQIDSEAMSFTHFGLAADLYTHFTSPIRRYADLLVHRLLASSIGAGELDETLKSSRNIQVFCDQINYRHRMAQFASRASARLHTVLYIKSKKVLVEEAYIFFVKQNAIQILIPKIAYEHTYFLQPSEDWQYDVVNRSQKNISKKINLKQFDRLRVHVSISTKEDMRFSDKIQVKIIKPALDDVSELDIVTISGEAVDEDIGPDQETIDSKMESADKFQEMKMIAHGWAANKKKIRLDLCETEASKPVVVVPGDTLENFILRDTAVLGPGLLKRGNKVNAIKSGLLKSRNKNLFWVDSNQRRYVPARADTVVGIVKSKGSLHARVDINAADLATLELLAFEGATKRNKPNLNFGDLVYAKVLAVGNDIETQLVCINSNGKKEGLGQIGEKGGLLIPLSIDAIRVLLSTNCDFLERLGHVYRYEVALGLNGRVWINANDAQTIVAIARELQYFERC